ncbi:MAG TPA: aromatic ring-hydroxylating dioxygenase subunit alpha [Holophagaceae bacterium]|nr:aromatic ring-hydroxylating dioxygenase subunit alpha [Holophagaceae bacterium]
MSPFTDFPFDADPAAAATLPARVYTDPAVLAAERDRIFGRTWQWVATLDQLSAPGSYLTTTVGREPVVVLKDEAGALRAFSAVCRHRAGPVALGSGQARALRCAYHGWTYGLDGRLKVAPEFEGVRGFDSAACRLPEFRVEAWGPWVFVNLDPAAPSLAETLGEILPETAHWRLDRLRAVRTVDYELACDWKVYVDNYLEGYHIPVAHPELHRQLDYAAYRVETRRWHSRQHAPVRAADTLYHRGGGPREGEAPEAGYYWVFPNLMLNLYPDNVQLNLIEPLGPGRTRTRFVWFVEDPARPGLDAELAENLAFSDAVQREDILLCESVQRGLASATYDRGRYSAKRENGLHHFHRLWVEAMRS